MISGSPPVGTALLSSPIIVIAVRQHGHAISSETVKMFSFLPGNFANRQSIEACTSAAHANSSRFHNVQRKVPSLLASIVPPATTARLIGEPTYRGANSRGRAARDSGDDQPTDQGHPTRCAPLYVQVSTRPDLVGIRLSSFDDPGWFRPEADIFVRSAQPWDYMDPNLPKIPTYPTGKSY
jgi:hypothetical protein